MATTTSAPHLIPRRRLLSPFASGVLALALAGLSLPPRVQCAGETTAPAVSAREGGQPFMESFGPREYHAHNQVWHAVQDTNGVLYFGNKGVVLSYDGAAWQTIPVGNTTFVRGLAYEAATDRIYVGGVSEIGYLQATSEGGRVFVSLLDRLPADARDFGDLWSADALPGGGGVVFVTSQQVMRWRDGAFKVWKLPNSSLLRGYVVGGCFYLHQRDLGLRRLEGDEFRPASADPVFNKSGVAGLFPRPDGTLLVFTRKAGEFLLRPDGTLTPVPMEGDAWLKDRQAFRSLDLGDGTFLLTTDNAGMVRLDAEGRIIGRFDESTGLPSEHVHDLCRDREGGVWVCHNAGVTRLELPSALSVFDTASGLKHATVHSFARWRGALLAATNAGVYRLRPLEPGTAAADDPRPARWERLPGLEGVFWALCVHGEGGLLAGGDQGLYQFAEGAPAAVRIVTGWKVQALHPSRQAPGRVFATDGEGTLLAVRWDGSKWADEGVKIATARDARTIVETPNGDLWLGTPRNGALRVEFDPAVPPTDKRWAKVMPFYKTAGLPAGQGWTRTVEDLGEEVLLSTEAGLFRFDGRAGVFRPGVGSLRRFTDGTMNCGTAASFGGRLWLSARTAGLFGDSEIGYLSLDREEYLDDHWWSLPAWFSGRVGNLETIFPEADGTVWFGGTEGTVLRVDGRQHLLPDKADKLIVNVRRVAVSGGEEQPAALALDAPTKPLPFRRNSLAFDFAAATFRPGATLRYQTLLEGPDAAPWSPWTERASAAFPHLPEGRYVFRVRARDADGRTGEARAFAFAVRPPWQRTAWAYTLYAALAAGAVWAVVRWRGRQLQRRNAALEGVVDARTAELRAREAELRTRETELLRARDEAEASNRAKSAFLAHMSHELRTPLNAILGYTRLLLKDRELSERTLERMSVVNQSGSHLLAMINEVLDLAKIEAGKLTLNPTVFRLDALLGEAVGAFRPRAADRGLEFRCLPADGLPGAVRADVGKLRQVIFNLLENALKFTEHGSVTLRVSPAGAGRVRCEVQDTGIGIAPEERPKVFLAFHQAAGEALSTQGAGLGLAISSRLVALLGGKLEVASEPGLGSRFWFEVDLPAVDGGGLFGAGGVGRAVPVAYRGPVRRVLVADDQAYNRVILRDLLAPLGFTVEEAEDGARCLERCAQDPPPDLLLLDLRMPGTDGLTVARTLRAQGRPVRVVAVSASVFESDRQQALAAGCDDFLPKPFEETQLLETVARLLGVEWVFADRPDTAGGTLFAGTDTPTQAEIAALLELARRGDILAIRRRLATLGEAEGGRYRAFTERLQPFVAGWQMHRIEEALQRFQSTQADHSPQPSPVPL